MAEFKDRIKSLRRINARDLIPNPKNWRTHPEHQQGVLRGVLDKIGIADAMLVRETKDGYMLVDGHLRAEVMDQKVPCLILDLSEEEADQLLLTLDPLASLATIDEERLYELINEVPDFDSDEVEAMLSSLAIQAGLATTEWEESIADTEAIGDYDEEGETGVVRIKCLKSDLDAVSKKVEQACKSFEGVDIRVF